MALAERTPGASIVHDSSARAMVRTSLLFVVAALLCLPWADLAVSTPDPWSELGRLGRGLLSPVTPSFSTLMESLANTLAFALQGVALGAVAGLVLALFYRHWWVRTFSAFARAIHELFWALLFVQLAGLSPLAGVLAIAIPYAGTFAKIYGELFEEVDPAAAAALPPGTSRLSAFFYTVLPPCWPHMVTYTRYRLECGIRSSAVLGFIGLPTVGFHLETALKQGQYSEAAALFYALVLVIVTLHGWMRRRLLPVYVLAAVWWLPPVAQVNWALVWQFFSSDVVPAPIRNGWNGDALWHWLLALGQKQILPGLANTVVLGLLALLATSAVTLLTFPWISRLFGNVASRGAGHVFLVLMRSAPEYLLAFVGLLLWGPGMLPAIVALALHNGAIIAHLVGHYCNELQLREDAVRGVNRYLFEVLPRIYRTFLAFTLYRFEILLRESAILGVLGIPTLGFFIDSAFSEFRFDRALLLLLVTALLNMLVDTIARHLRRRLQLSTHPEDL